MKKILSCIVGILLLTSILAWAFNFQSAGCSEPPETEWTRTYGGASDDRAQSMVQTRDGGYAITGITESFGAGNWDFWLIKTNSTGDMQWNQTYGGADRDVAESVVQASDGGYAIGGSTRSRGAGVFDFWLVKTDAAGNMQWNRTYGGTNHEQSYSMIKTSDGGYLMAGMTRSWGAGHDDFWLVKTNSTGHMEWNQTYGGTSLDNAKSVVQTRDGGYAITGNTKSFGAGNGDFWLIKTDASGNALWNKTYGGTNDDSGECIIQTSDGGYAITGWTKSFGAGDRDY